MLLDAFSAALDDLHSTMLLLYQRSRADDVGRFSSIYIPLCFYFIENDVYLSILRDSFTFHYASTLS